MHKQTDNTTSLSETNNIQCCNKEFEDQKFDSKEINDEDCEICFEEDEDTQSIEIDNNVDRRLRRSERLRSRNEITLLFSKGKSFVSYPFRIVYVMLPENSDVKHAAMFVSVPKKKFKRAVKRNLIRRRAKEAYRLNKNIITDFLKANNLKIGIAFLYLDKEIRNYSDIEKPMKEMLYKLKEKLEDKYIKR